MDKDPQMFFKHYLDNFPILYNPKRPTYTWQIYLSNNNNAITATYYENPPKKGSITYYIEYGETKKQVHSHIVRHGKNIGKLNETNYFKQAISDIFSLYVKKINKGYVLYTTAPVTRSKSIASLIKNNSSLMVYPMNLHRLHFNIKKLTFPILCQRKYNGVLCVLIQYKNTVYMYSRNKKWFGKSVDHIKHDFETHVGVPNTYFVGELYIEHTNLQDIISIVQNKSKQSNVLNFYIFDWFVFGDTTTPAVDRDRYIQELHSLTKKKSQYIHFVVSDIAHNLNEIYKLESEYVHEGYEGIVVRLMDKPYQYDELRAIRSYYIFKDKKVYEDNFPVVDYLADKKGNVMFVCAQSDELNSDTVIANRKTFKVVPNWRTDIRHKVYLALRYKHLFDKLYLKKALVYYNGISKDNIPLQAKLEIFVDDKIQRLINAILI